MGDIDHEFWARKTLAYLIKCIRNFQGGEKFVTYGLLAKEIGYPEPHIGNLFGRNIGRTLGVMGHLFDDILIDGEEVPLIQALVVNQSQKLPSDGLKEFNSTYPNLSIEKKRDFAQSEYRLIFDFGTRWETVLKQLGIQENEAGASHPIPSEPPGRHNPYGSEGSPEHVALRDFIANNPETIGLDNKIIGITEYPLKSGDAVDVVFETENEVIAVEVKSIRSGVDDIERGLYQCVKYQAVLGAENIIKNSQKRIRSLLVMQGVFPRKLIPVRKKLKLDAKESFATNLSLDTISDGARLDNNIV